MKMMPTSEKYIKMRHNQVIVKDVILDSNKETKLQKIYYSLLRRAQLIS